MEVLQTISPLLLFSQVIQSSRWSLKIPWSVWAVRGSCAEIPCPFDHPSKSSNPQIRWLKGASVVYDSAHPGGAGAEYGGRTGLKGNLFERQCSLLIKNISSRDEGEYHIRVRITTERVSSVEYSSQIVVSLCIREKLRISAPGQLIVGKPANLTCSLRFFKLSCLASNLKLNWAQDAGSPPILSDAETAQKIRRNFAGSWTVSSTFTLTPSLDHQEKTLTCEFIGADGWKIAQEAVRLKEVQDKPTIVSGPTCTCFKNGVVCTCSVRAKPPANTTWHLSGRNITGNSSEVGVHSWTLDGGLVNSSLILVHPTGSGKLIWCITENEHGVSVREFWLHLPGSFWRIILPIRVVSTVFILFAILVIMTTGMNSHRNTRGVADKIKDTDTHEQEQFTKCVISHVELQKLSDSSQRRDMKGEVTKGGAKT
ncbi:sialic acid-binding Ig-like lectin 13 [Cetorhinus maximus]